MTAGLSQRQIECLRLVAEGITSSKLIADRLGLAPSSVDNYLSRAAHQLGVRGREEAAAAFLALQVAPNQDSAESSVLRSVSRPEALVPSAKTTSVGPVAALRWLLAVPPIGGAQHRFNRIEILFSILKVAAVSLAVFAALVLLGSGLVWLMGR